jgi:hypothetical protein
MKDHFGVRVIVVMVLFSSVLIPSLYVHDEKQVYDRSVMETRSPDDIQDCRGPMLLTQQEFSNICQADYMSCVLSQYGPVYSPCWCIGPSGPVKGVLVPMR